MYKFPNIYDVEKAIKVREIMMLKKGVRGDLKKNFKEFTIICLKFSKALLRVSYVYARDEKVFSF
ncbi:hypothetical protein H704_00107 [Bartonella bacilliformis Peru38]|uniref:Uncharacterized protein n=2 Tax=Bartonella bacilliformis TaxID=774 RepID=A1UR45_BARBK|nr:hypothetical protein BARBAKC583_0110 [Bartonella bacilliformis KC583]AMG85339.1 hypothetical protein AL467_00700 [Bartonella bacilliformis]EKS46004.1 hypothetical protein BbINS_00530 [Bartonella bacilliformis INS]EYS95459.1 hypothetical protein X470_00047 [Bartonella bacilliformis Peru-18]KEG22089.1 hypothetical protein H704_00107 [Bartonella bacilliformis Peru38]